jgi:hypothetical protein
VNRSRIENVPSARIGALGVTSLRKNDRRRHCRVYSNIENATLRAPLPTRSRNGRGTGPAWLVRPR